MINLNLIPRRPYTVIFADDDPDTLQFLKVLASHEGWQVETATSAEELLEKVKSRCEGSERCFDIVVTDVSFFSGGQPGVSGIAAGRQLERAYPNLPILFLTGYNGLLTRENVREIASADYLEKPVDPRDLIMRIEHLIQFTRADYDGPERRRTSVNRTAFARRSTDKNLGVPKVLKLVMGMNV